MIYFISDLHLNHTNIIKYCSRPFSTVEEMNNILIANWNKIIGLEDVVYYGGDFALGPKKVFRRISECLNGHKHFIRGNHDHISKQQILESGWETVSYKVNLEYAGKKLLLQHHPDADVADDVILVYGHVHNKPAERLPHQSFCMCVERNNYKPVSIDWVLENLDIK